MRVLFLALGGNRQPAVIEESRIIAATGGRPTVLVAGLGRWADAAFAPGVAVVPLSRYPRHWPLAVEHLLLFRGPRLLVRRLAGSAADRVLPVYIRLVANRVHRWLVRPVYQRLWPDGVHRQLDAFLAESGRFDAVIVSDARSFPAAQHAVDRLTATGTRPRVAFRVEPLLEGTR